MSLAHVCPACGNQLARTRAVADAVYSLPIVVCGCGFAAVRRKHPIVVGWRRGRAAAGAFIFLTVHILVLTGLSLATGAFVAGLEQDLRGLRLTPGSFLLAIFGGSAGNQRAFNSWLADGGGVIFLIGFAFASTAAGIWLRTVLAHWLWPRALLAWAILASGWVWFEALIWPLTWLDSVATGARTRYSGPDIVGSIHMAEILAASLLVTSAAMPIGTAISRATAWSRRKRFIKKLNKRRKARRGE